MTLYPMSIRAQIDPSLPAEVARHEAVQLALRLNAAVTWEDQIVTPLDGCLGSCPLCHGHYQSQGTWEAP